MSPKWLSFHVQDFTARSGPLVCPLNKDIILIYGGENDTGTLTDGVIWNSNTWLTANIIEDSRLELYSRSLGCAHTCVSLVQDTRDFTVKLVEFDKTTLSFSTVKELGNFM